MMMEQRSGNPVRQPRIAAPWSGASWGTSWASFLTALAVVLLLSGCDGVPFLDVGGDGVTVSDSSSEAVACAVGQGGIILLCDAQGNWAQVVSPVSSDLLDVDFGDAIHGWAVGANGAVVCTADGGRTWSSVPGIDPRAALVAVSGMDANSALVVGLTEGNVNAYVIRKGACERQMALVPSGTEVQAIDVDFANATSGWLMVSADRTEIFKTVDGALTWSHRRLGFPGWGEAIASHGPRALTVVGGLDRSQNPVVIESLDAGLSWRMSRLPGGPSFAGRYLRSVAFADGLNGWAVSNVEDGLILATHDGGLHWSQQESQPGLAPSRVAASSVSTVFATTTGRDVLRTTDGGQDWTAESPLAIRTAKLTAVTTLRQ